MGGGESLPIARGLVLSPRPRAAAVGLSVKLNGLGWRGAAALHPIVSTYCPLQSPRPWGRKRAGEGRLLFSLPARSAGGRERGSVLKKEAKQHLTVASSVRTGNVVQEE